MIWERFESFLRTNSQNSVYQAQGSTGGKLTYIVGHRTNPYTHKAIASGQSKRYFRSVNQRVRSSGPSGIGVGSPSTSEESEVSSGGVNWMAVALAFTIFPSGQNSEG